MHVELVFREALFAYVLFYWTENLVDFADLLFVFQEDTGIEVWNHVIRRVADELIFTRMRVEAQLYRIEGHRWREMKSD